MYPLKLSANFEAWKAFTVRKSHKDFLQFSQRVFARDDYSCQFCGFQAKEFQEVVSLDGDYYQAKLANSVTACCFCAQCLFLESVGTGNFGGGTLIYLPEVSQADLNSFCHVIFCAINNDTEYKSSSEAIYRSLKFRAHPIEEQFGEGTSEPSVFGQLLIDSGNQNNQELQQVMQTSIRLLPSRIRFKTQIERWSKIAMSGLSTSD